MKTVRALAPFSLLALLALTLSGCATVPPPPPVTVPQIVQMSHDKVPPEEIVDRMRTSGTVYRLDAAQLAKLHEEGVSNTVIDYMQRTYLRAVRQRQELQDWDHWTNVEGWWYGGWPYGWSDDWMPDLD